MLDPVQFVLVAIAGWMNRRQEQTIAYLREENRILRFYASSSGIVDCTSSIILNSEIKHGSELV